MRLTRATSSADHGVEINPVEPAVGIVQYLVVADPQHFARCRQFPTAERGQLFVALRGATVPRGRSGSQADKMDFDAALAVEQQSASESAGLVVRMGSHAK